MSSPIASALQLSPDTSSAESLQAGTYLYIYASGYNQSLHSVSVEGIDSEDSLYAEDSEPIGIGVALKLAPESPSTSELFQSIQDETLNRGLIEIEPGYLACKSQAAKSQGIEAKYVPLKPALVDVYNKDLPGEWECLYLKSGDLSYLGECDEYEFEEDDKDVFSAGYIIESVEYFALVDISAEGELAFDVLESSGALLSAAEERHLFVKPSSVARFKSLYEGKTFVLFGLFEWCPNLDELSQKLTRLGLKEVSESEKPDVVFLGAIDSSEDGIYARWEKLVSSYPIQHGKFTEPSLKDVFETAS